MIIDMDRLREVDGCIERYGQIVTIITGECECAICQGESDAAMDNPESIDHLGSHFHCNPAMTIAYLQQFDAEPLAEEVVL